MVRNARPAEKCLLGWPRNLAFCEDRGGLFVANALRWRLGVPE